MFKHFKPGISLTVCVFIAFGILLALGTWQALKVAPKTAFLKHIEQGLAADAMILPVIDPAQPNHLEAFEYRRVYFTGVRIADPVKVVGTNRAGQSGYYLYAPVMPNLTEGVSLAVIVNFGWIPFEQEVLPSLPGRPIKFNGVLVANPVAGSMTPANIPEVGQWYIADIHELAEYFEVTVGGYYPFRVFVDHTGSQGDLPLGGQVRVDIPNNHFQYMLTWYGLAIALVGVYVAFGFKTRDHDGAV